MPYLLYTAGGHLQARCLTSTADDLAVLVVSVCRLSWLQVQFEVRRPGARDLQRNVWNMICPVMLYLADRPMR